jgi:Protein of unknown function, DUF594
MAVEQLLAYLIRRTYSQWLAYLAGSSGEEQQECRLGEGGELVSRVVLLPDHAIDGHPARLGLEKRPHDIDREAHQLVGEALESTWHRRHRCDR